MYVPLNIRTDYSLLYSMIKINDLVKFAKENNLKALTITDDNMFGAMEFYKACTNNNIKPIIGLNVILNESNIVLYAKTHTGYVNLLKVSTLYREGKLDTSILVKYKEDIICILPYEFRSIYKELKEIYKDIFVSYKNDEEEKKINIENKVFMNEILCLSEEESENLSYLNAIKENKLVDKKMSGNFLDLSEDRSLENNNKIFEMCNVKIIKNNNLMPKFKIPDNYDTSSYLRYLCKEGLKKRFGNTITKNYIERLKYEIEVIENMGFSDYFLIVSDYIKFAKNNNILVGPGRGSAVGSLVAYCLEITEIDPLKYDLLFERFLNSMRITMPDIDVDFEGERRIEVINYCIDKYGSKCVSGVITFPTLAAKQVLKDVGRTLDLNLEEVEYLCSMINSKETLSENLSQDRIKNHLNKNSELKELYEIAIKLEGLKKTTSVNASGIVMSDEPLDNYIPLEKHENMYLSGYTMNYLEDVGLLKMDFLALKNLTTISNVVEEIGNVDLNNIPLDDVLTLNVFKTANTLGIFQFETDGMINMLTKFRPTTFEDIFNISALFRPGPSENIDSYIRRKDGKEKIDYLHPSLINILKPTYGIIIYQEQIMQMANVMANYTLGEADILRRAMSKKKEDVIINEKEKFITRSLENGYELELSKKIYELILKFAEYGFNKSHSVAYATISYQMAYLKAHYPVYFLKNLLSSVAGSEKSTKEYINECKKNNIKILPPDINKSTAIYLIEEEGIRYPLSGIRNIGTAVINNILDSKKESSFKDVFDFLKRVDKKIVNRRVITNLINAGVFDNFEINRRTLIENLDIIMNYAELLSDLGEAYAIKPELIIFEEYNKKELIKKEFEVFGNYLNNHPILEFRKEYNKPLTLSNTSLYMNKVIDIILCIDNINEIINKNKDKMCFLKCSDEVTTIDGVIFSEAYKIYNDISVGDIVKITGKIDRRNGKDQIICNKIEILDK